MIAKYPYYKVEKCDSFKSYIEKIHNKYRDRIAIMNRKKCWTYNELYSDVLKMSSYFSENENLYYTLLINDTYLFCVAFLAAASTSKVSILDNNLMNDKIPIINDELVFHILYESDNIETLKIDDAINANNVCIIINSSGTTSVSKGVMLSQKNLLTELINLMRMYEFPDNAIYYHYLPYKHLFGLMGEILLPLYSGGTVCYSDDRYSFFSNLKFFKPTHMNLTPAAVDSIIQVYSQTHDLDIATGGKIKKIVTGGAYISEEKKEWFRQKGINIYSAYGLTECSPCISIERDDSPKRGSVGQILPCCDVKIIEGEITVKGETVMVGYWNDALATKMVKKNGRLYTGDLGIIDSEGYLFLKGRKTDIIVFKNGQKLNPTLLENDLLSVDSIVECLATNKGTDEKVKVDIYAVIKDIEKKENVLQMIISICNDYFPVNYLGEIHLGTKPLKRNSLGKICRMQ